MLTIPAVYLPWIATALFVAIGIRMMRPKSEWDFSSGISGLAVIIIGSLSSWLIYFMVLYFSKK